MKIAIAELENQFETSLDAYCHSLEHGDEERAREEAYRAGDYLDAIKVLKTPDAARVLKHRRFMEAVMAAG